MCYNCGCGMLDDEMGNADNLTNKDFEKAAKATGQPVREAKENTLKALKKDLGKE